MTRDQAELVACLAFILWFLGVMLFVVASIRGTRWHIVTSLLWPVTLPLILVYESIKLALIGRRQ